MFNISNIDYTIGYDSVATTGEKVFESRGGKRLQLLNG